MQHETSHPRLAEVLDCRYYEEPHEVILSMEREVEKARARIVELEKVNSGIVRTAGSTLSVPELSRRMLAAFWAIQLQDPESLVPRSARRIFCEQTGLIVGVPSLSFKQAIALCQEAHEELIRFDAVRKTFTGIRMEVDSMIADEKSFLEACIELKERIAKQERDAAS
jgi:hypothetical protein